MRECQKTCFFLIIFRYCCSLHWEDDITLLIGWADSVKIVKIKDRESRKEGLPSRYGEVVAMCVSFEGFIFSGSEQMCLFVELPLFKKT